MKVYSYLICRGKFVFLNCFCGWKIAACRGEGWVLDFNYFLNFALIIIRAGLFLHVIVKHRESLINNYFKIPSPQLAQNVFELLKILSQCSTYYIKKQRQP